MPIMQGFVGQRSFEVSRNEKGRSHSIATDPGHESNPAVGVKDVVVSQPIATKTQTCRLFLLTLISRRSTKRSGLRYLRRGIDDDGNVANEVETEQILSSPNWDGKIFSFVQIRGSIPLYFSQTPYSFKPVPALHQSAATNEAALKRHFEGLRRRYGDVQIALLVDRHDGELTIGEAYQNAVKQASDSSGMAPLKFEWFDFHAECRGMRFENVERLVKKLDDSLTSFGETVLEEGKVVKRQSGIIRTNCMDCLDRTNVTQSAFGQNMLQRDLRDAGFEIDLLHDEKTTWINEIWADNGDAISRQYASTAALKGDFTRTRKRNYRGALNDLGLTLSRYYNNMFNDFFHQAIIDVLLGNVSSKVFEDFETTMRSADPGISIEKVRETAIEMCSKIVIQDPEEDIVHGWILLTPAQPNTLRTLPLEEAVVLLTDAALYCCKFDWNTEKIVSFQKVDLRAIQKIQYGTYITSILTDRQLDEKLNVGLVVFYNIGQGSMIRVNTRSLQNSVPTKGPYEIDGSAGILSWFGTRAVSSSSSTMAFKVIPRISETEDRLEEQPIALAKHISEEIRRMALAGAAGKGSQSEDMQSEDIVEKGDIISLEEAKKRTGYLEQASFMIKKLVWT
jgi:SacI homology domain/Inositol phosphatase